MEKRLSPRCVCIVLGAYGKLIEETKILSPDEVLFELERGGDDICTWAKERQSIFIPPGSEVQRIVTKIVDNYPNFLPETSNDGVWADPYVIAFAVSSNGCVITGERKRGQGAKLIAIPNVCSDLGIECITLLDLIRRENWRF